MEKLSIFLLFIGIISCGQSTANFSESELTLIKKLGFEKSVLSDLKNQISGEFIQLEISEAGYSINESGEKEKSGVEKINGISFSVPENASDEIIFSYKNQLKQNGYFIFLSESGYKSPSTISIIKSDNKFEILKIQKTDGINYDLENKDVIQKLQEWDNRYGIEILGADYDWVDFVFIKDIENITAFAKEVYNFCPDSVDQGVGEIEILEQLIKEEKRLFLWWD